MAPTQVDHIVLLLPHKDLVNPPGWLSDNFTIAPGGVHAGGRTENKLIIFRDGTYIELISFTDDSAEHRSGHWWGDKNPGFIDFAVSTPGELDYDALTARIAAANTGLNIGYLPPVAGGRTRPDGAELKWKVTFPEHGPRGEIPFWCNDVTPRSLRVPTDPKVTTHPCGALGLAYITVLVPEEKVDGFAKLYSAVLDLPAKRAMGTNSWHVRAPVPLGGMEDPLICVEKPTHDFEKRAVKELGGRIAEIALKTEGTGIGWSRERILEKIDGEEVCIFFLYGKMN